MASNRPLRFHQDADFMRMMWGIQKWGTEGTEQNRRDVVKVLLHGTGSILRQVVAS